MYHLVLGIQLVSIAALFVESWMVFKYWKNRVHSWLFLACIAMLVNNLGYFLQLTSFTRAPYLTALKFSYLGRVWITYALLMFVVELTGKKIPRIVRVVLAGLCAATYLVMATTERTGLYYREMAFVMNQGFPDLDRIDGPWHYVWNGILGASVIYGIYLLISAGRKETNPTARKRLLMVFFSILAQGLFLVIEMFRLLPVTRVYDVTMLSFPIATVFMFFALLKYRLLDTQALAREYAIDELSEGIIAVDERDMVSFYNRPAENLFPELENDSASVIRELQKAIDEKEPIRLSGRIYSPDVNQLSRNGQNAGRIYALTDDTEHYQYMAELEEQRAIADRANQAKSRFLANMSHEIRTPINAVLGMDEMILRESEDEEILSYASDIQTAGNTLLSLINDILDLSKIEEGRMEILPVQYQFSVLVKDLINMIRGRAEKKNLRLSVLVNSETPDLLYGDEIRIRQIVLNLLTNAVKYTEQGEVELRADFEKIEEEEIALSFTIRDTGIGIKEEDLKKLFAPFSRIEEKRNRSIEGSGLGMSIVRQLLDLMGSALSVKSVYGEGSEFSFTIRQKVVKWEPVGEISAESKDMKKRTAYHVLFTAPDARILVVDDTEVNLTVVRNLLKQTRLGIDTASSGEDALSLVKEHSYDVLLIDHMMPNMDGIETLHRMQEEAAWDGPCIALTANAVSGARERYLSEGFSDYLSKPVDGHQLEEMLFHYLPEDKVHPADPKEDAALKEEKEELPEWLFTVEDLDPEAGLINCGSVDSYISVLSTFHQTAEGKAAEIESLYEQGNIADYTIKVHALKSSARIIGAAALSKMAEDLENAGKAGDPDFIRQQNGNLVRSYRELDAKLSPLDPDAEAKKPLSPEMRSEAFRTMGELAETMDFGMMEDFLKDLKGYQLSDEDTGLLKKAEECLFALDWDGIREIQQRSRL